MYRRYRIETTEAKLVRRPGKFRILRDQRCLNCGLCVTWCIYDVHRRDEEDPRMMAEPRSHLCKNCFSCIQNCPQQSLAMVPDEEYERLGNASWTPDKIWTIWNEADEGKIPIYGAGYRGPFQGSGFDEIWTDMSEIVRPTRDGIHGRETISTAVDIGRKLSCLTHFQGRTLPCFQEIQVPFLLNANPLALNSKPIILAIVKSAAELGTLVFLDADNYFSDLKPYLKSIALRLPLKRMISKDSELWKEVSFVEVFLPLGSSRGEIERFLERLKGLNRGILISLAIREAEMLEEILPLFQEGMADILSFHADNEGRSTGGSLFITQAVREIHLRFVKEGTRDEVTVLGKGGIAAAEHVPKLIICGADAVVLDLALLVALGCRVCKECKLDSCPSGLANIDPEFASQRIINMAAAWRDQLLEILGAMGIRDVRRLRGEMGRAMFYEEVEMECFASVFKGENLPR